MNVRQLVEQTGLSGNTIRRAIKKVCPEKVKNGIKIELSESEVEQVKNWLAVNNSFLINLTSPNGKVTSPDGKVDYVTRSEIKEIVSEVVITVLKEILPLLKVNEINHEGKTPQIEAPKISNRARLRELINNYVTDHGCQYVEAWAKLYQAIYYRLNINVPLCAKNRGIDKLDYIEQSGIMPDTLLIAKEIYK